MGRYAILPSVLMTKLGGAPRPICIFSQRLTPFPPHMESEDMLELLSNDVAAEFRLAMLSISLHARENKSPFP